jgi:hypothetical protein
VIEDGVRGIRVWRLWVVSFYYLTM